MVKQRKAPAPKPAAAPIDDAAVNEWAQEAENGSVTPRKPWEGKDPTAPRYKRANPSAKALTLTLNEYEYLRLIEASQRAHRKPLDFIRSAMMTTIDDYIDD